ncbi:MAG: flagellar protein FliT [Lachnospiraceae bacterium]|nr:flagellar protein FliT [Lachnospiraceae bacterium]
MSNQYVDIMIDALVKKSKLLDRIINLNKQQRNFLNDPNLGPDDLELNIKQKGAIVDEILELDTGFNQVYSRIKDELENNKETYKEEIARLKELIREVTDKSQTVQSQEARNKELLTKKLSSVKARAKTVRNSARVIDSYAKMTNYVSYDPQFMDDKK